MYIFNLISITAIKLIKNLLYYIKIERVVYYKLVVIFYYYNF